MQFFSRKKSKEESVTEKSSLPERMSAQPALPQKPIGFDTVLGAGATIEGHLKSEGNIRMDGIFTGELEITGNVLVGETAQINADIDAKNISIAGAVHGNVSGNKVQLLRTARVWGNINATALTTEEGAFIDGKISMHSKPSGEVPVTSSDTSAHAQETNTVEVDATLIIEDEQTDIDGEKA